VDETMTEEDYTPLTIIHGSKNTIAYLTGEIGHCSKYIDLFELLRTATPEETIEIIINSFGGSCDTGYHIIDLIRECKAIVTTSIYGHAASVASMVFMAGNNKKVSDHATMHAHYYSSDFYAKGSDIEADVLFHKKLYGHWMHEIYAHFMSDKEIDDLLDGKEFWFSSEEIKERLERS
jgi:ATP-dependent protease ClpP protease subunit